MPYADIEKRRQTQRERYWRDPIRREHLIAKSKIRYAENKEAAYLAHIKKAYGLTADDYQTLVDNQKNLCALCGCPPPHKHYSRLHLDHDHVTGRVRGLLCFHCNWRIGWLEKRRQAINDYLDKSREICYTSLSPTEGA